jgi:hypothetical protein
MENIKPRKPVGFAIDRKRASEAGKKSSANLTPEQRRERAYKSSMARWDRRKGEDLGYEDIKDLGLEK